MIKFLLPSTQFFAGVLLVSGFLMLSQARAQVAAPGELPLTERSYEEITEYNGKPIKPLSPSQRTAIREIISVTGNPSSDPALFEQYMNYEIAHLTMSDARDDLPRLCDSIKKTLQKMDQLPSHNAHTEFNNALLKQLPQIATSDRYHPVARINTMLLLGNLDQVEQVGQSPPLPLPAAMKPLYQTLTDPKQLDAVRIAALDGILRHAELGPALGSDIVETLQKIVASDKPVQSTQDASHEWMRRRAAQALGALARQDHLPAGDNATVNALAKLLADKNASLFARCDAMQALGQTAKARYSGTDVKGMVLAAAGLVLDIANASKQPDIDPSWLVNFMAAVDTGFKGPVGRGLLEGAGDKETSQMAGELSRQIDSLLTDLAKIARAPNPDATRVRALFEIKVPEIEQWLKTNGGEKPSDAAAPGAIVPAPK